MSTEKRKHKTKVLNEDIYNELLKNENQAEDLKLELSDLENHDTTESISLNIIAEHYHKELYNHPQALDYLKKLGITKLELLSIYQIGFSNGKSLIDKLSKNQVGTLIERGILKESGQEAYASCLTFPIIDELSQIQTIYGININTNEAIKPLTSPKDIFFNDKSIKIYSDRIIFAESIIEALSFIELGFNNAIACGIDAMLTVDHIYRLKAERVKEIVIACGSDVALITASEMLREMINDAGVNCRLIYTPVGFKNWNDVLVNGIDKETVNTIIESAELFKPKDTASFKVTKNNFGSTFLINDITYHVSGVKEIFVNSLKVSIKAEYQGDWFPDMVELCSSRSREAISAKFAQKFNLEAKRFEKDLLLMFDYFDREQKKRFTVNDKTKKVELTEEEIKLGLDFLKSPDLFEQIVNDMDTMLCVGERLNKQLLYLCATSRLMDNQISMLLLSQSASGKTYLVETLAKLIPEDEVIDFDTLSKQALQYIGDKLMNKFLIMGEAMHDPDIEHQIRAILSSQKLSRYVVVKNEKTGEMTTEQMLVKTAASSVLTTTNDKINPENASRYFITNTDESPEQTKRIYEAQRKKYSEEMQYIKKVVIPQIIKKHNAAQRLLRKITIVIPSRMREALRFPDKIMRLRRDHLRFIDLIASVCFLRQYQKEIKKTAELEYIECDAIDYLIAFDILMNGVLPSTISEISKGAIALHEELKEMAQEIGREKRLNPEEVELTQRKIREYTGFGNTWIKINLKKLVEFEYIEVVRGGSARSKGYYRIKKDDEIKRVDLGMIPTPRQMEKILKGDIS